MGVRIVTDSTADLPESIRQELGIFMVPLTVHFGPESYMDTVEMGVDAFWEKLRTSSHHPKTAQPSPGDFLKVYQEAAKDGDEIVSIHISSKLSGTMSSAQIAAQMMPEAKITHVDTRSATWGLGMMAIEAARMAKAGRSAAAIVSAVEAIADRMHIFFTLDTLEFLQKNGRIGRAQALLGGLLGIKPILQVDREGLVAPADKVRGKSKIIPRSMELMQERVPAGRKIKITFVHCKAPEEAAQWVEAVRSLYTIDEYWIGDLGPVVATNVGPGTVGVCFYEV
ncbi:MAG TPA: DegV family protein [Symbiobacteriaceae bacterium]|jgi:DegV family protein with EDD domain|nr:DegV family protein [Symbiobacteriaceae bacterium]